MAHSSLCVEVVEECRSNLRQLQCCLLVEHQHHLLQVRCHVIVSDVGVGCRCRVEPPLPVVRAGMPVADAESHGEKRRPVGGWCETSGVVQQLWTTRTILVTGKAGHGKAVYLCFNTMMQGTTKQA